MVVVQHRLDEQPVQLDAVAQPAAGQVAALFSLLADAFQGAALLRLGGGQFAKGTLQVGRQQAVEAADHYQGHVVGRVPAVTQGVHLLQGHVVEVGALRAFQA